MTSSFFLLFVLDSLVFTLPPGAENPLKVGPCLWQYKNEIPQGWRLSAFYCLAPKLYEMVILNDATGETKTWTKVKGFTVKSERQQATLLGQNVFQSFTDAYLEGKDVSVNVGQWNIRVDKARNLRSVICDKILRNNIFSKRVAFRGLQYRVNNKNNMSLPYGFNEAMYNKYMM